MASKTRALLARYGWRLDSVSPLVISHPLKIRMTGDTALAKLRWLAFRDMGIEAELAEVSSNAKEPGQ